MISYNLDRRDHDLAVIEFEQWNSTSEQWFMLTGDRHHDSTRTDRELELEQLELALKRDAYVIDVGDFFDAMQGKYDPRRNYDDYRKEYLGQHFFDNITKGAANYYGEKYGRNFMMIGRGNHEVAVSSNANQDLIETLTHRLRSDHKSPVFRGDIHGWIVLSIPVYTTKRRIIIYYHHGAGGGGPVTKGVIQTNRQAAYISDADVVINGHTHDAWVLALPKYRINMMNNKERFIQWFVRTPGYKMDFDTEGGHANLKWQPPKPRGCVWLRVYTRKRDEGWCVDVEATQDIH